MTPSASRWSSTGTAAGYSRTGSAAMPGAASAPRAPPPLQGTGARGAPRRGEGDKVAPPVGVRLSPRVLDLIGQMSGDQPRGAWIRGAVLEKLARDLGVTLEVLDPSPHLAPRRGRGGTAQRKTASTQREAGKQ